MTAPPINWVGQKLAGFPRVPKNGAGFLFENLWQQLVNEVNDRRAFIGQPLTSFSYVGKDATDGEFKIASNGGPFGPGGERNWPGEMIRVLLGELKASIEFCAKNPGTNGHWTNEDGTPYSGPKDVDDSLDFNNFTDWQFFVGQIRLIVDNLRYLGVRNVQKLTETISLDGWKEDEQVIGEDFPGLDGTAQCTLDVSSLDSWGVQVSKFDGWTGFRSGSLAVRLSADALGLVGIRPDIIVPTPIPTEHIRFQLRWYLLTPSQFDAFCSASSSFDYENGATLLKSIDSTANADAFLGDPSPAEDVFTFQLPSKEFAIGVSYEVVEVGPWSTWFPPGSSHNFAFFIGSVKSDLVDGVTHEKLVDIH